MKFCLKLSWPFGRSLARSFFREEKIETFYFLSGSPITWCAVASRCRQAHWESEVKPPVTMITLGVDNLERALKFYRDGLGFPTQGIVGTEFEHGAVAFFDLQQGVKLAL